MTVLSDLARPCPMSRSTSTVPGDRTGLRRRRSWSRSQSIGKACLLDECSSVDEALGSLQPSIGVGPRLIDHASTSSYVLDSAGHGLNDVDADEQSAHRQRSTRSDECQSRFHRSPEQRAIAAALSDVDALLGGLDRLIAKKRDLKQAAMQQLLTGQTRLPGFHGEWEVKRLGEHRGYFLTTAAMRQRCQFSERDSSICIALRTISRSTDDLQPLSRNSWVSPSEVETADCSAFGDIVFADSRERGRRSVNQFRMSSVTAHWSSRASHRARDTRQAGDRHSWVLCGILQSHIGSSGVAQRRRKLDLDINSNRSCRASSASLPAVPEQTAIAAVLSDMDAELRP